MTQAVPPLALARDIELLESTSDIREALRLMERKLHTGVWSLHLQTWGAHWSPGMFTILGLDPRTARPSRALFESVMHPEDQRLTVEFSKALKEGLDFDREFRIIRSDGRIRWVRSTAEVVSDETGKPERAVGTLQDITDHQEALHAEQTWRDRYRALVTAVKSLIWITRPDAYAIEIENLEYLPGPPKDRKQFLGEAWKETIHPDDLERIMQAWNVAFETQRPFEFEKRTRQADGSYRWTRCRVAPFFNNDGSVRGWIGVSTDIHHERDWSAPGSPRALTGMQIRSARGMLNWSVRDLAHRAGVSPAVIRRLEERDDAPSEPEPAMAAIKAALEGGGVEFLFPAVGHPGLRPAVGKNSRPG